MEFSSRAKLVFKNAGDFKWGLGGFEATVMFVMAPYRLGALDVVLLVGPDSVEPPLGCSPHGQPKSEPLLVGKKDGNDSCNHCPQSARSSLATWVYF